MQDRAGERRLSRAAFADKAEAFALGTCFGAHGFDRIDGADSYHGPWAGTLSWLPQIAKLRFYSHQGVQ
ncbi:hypothetical protein [Ensifer sp. CCNWLY38]|uniref:hypothetical protein n=1 Tax=unclassified Ensifer TaxID=2633371 RepID=UPI003FA55240